jgi:hypothetical protein
VIGSIGRAMARCALCVAAAMLTRRPCKIPTNSTSRQRDYLLLELLDPVHCALQHERGFCAAHRAIRRQISYDSTRVNSGRVPFCASDSITTLIKAQLHARPGPRLRSV